MDLLCTESPRLMSKESIVLRIVVVLLATINLQEMFMNRVSLEKEDLRSKMEIL